MLLSPFFTPSGHFETPNFSCTEIDGDLAKNLIFLMFFLKEHLASLLISQAQNSPPKISTITSFTLSVDQSNIRLSLAVCFLFDSFYVAMIGPAESDDEIEDEIEDANEDEVEVDD